MFSEQFFELLKEKQITINELGPKLNVSPQAVGQILNRNDLRESQMIQYAKAIGYDVEITLRPSLDNKDEKIKRELKKIAEIIGYDANFNKFQKWQTFIRSNWFINITNRCLKNTYQWFNSPDRYFLWRKLTRSTTTYKKATSLH